MYMCPSIHMFYRTPLLAITVANYYVLLIYYLFIFDGEGTCSPTLLRVCGDLFCFPVYIKYMYRSHGCAFMQPYIYNYIPSLELQPSRTIKLFQYTVWLEILAGRYFGGLLKQVFRVKKNSWGADGVPQT